MLAYIILIAAVIGLWPLLGRLSFDEKKKKMTYCIVCGALLVLLASTRAAYSGFGDDSMYMKNFEYVKENTFVEIFDYFKMQDTEVVFYELTKIVSLFTSNYNILLVVCAIPIVFIVSRAIYKFSKMPQLSYLIFSCAFFFLWSMVILRQAIAMAFVVVALEFLLKKKYWKFLVAVGCAVLFHRTAIILLIALPLSFLRYSKKSVVVFVLLCGIGGIFGNQIVDMFMRLFVDAGHFSAYLTRMESFGNLRQVYKFVVYGLLTGVTIVFSNEKFKKSNSLLIYSCLVGCLLCALAPFFAETYRLALYFMLPLIVVLPNSMQFIKDKKKRTFLIGAIGISLVVLGFATFYSMGYQNIFI